MAEPILVGIDVGGTFTDFVLWRAGELHIYKAPTTPDDQSRAIVQGLAELTARTGVYAPAALAHTRPPLIIVHGMTVATNALLERRGAVTALLTTEGFGDVLVIGRQNRPQLYQLSQSRPPALAPEHLRFEVDERLAADGLVLRPLDASALPGLAQQLQAQQVESLAIVFLFSFRNPDHEQRAAAGLRALLPDLHLSVSSEILPEYREFERTATTVINAYVQPLVARYLERLDRALTASAASPAGAAAEAPSVRIMQSNGGVISLAQAAAQAARVVLSGPAGGVVGAFAVARAAGLTNILTFDMGGTSTDVCLCPGHIPTTAESVITDLPLRLPVIDIRTVGAGGGSIAVLDAGGALRVGPRSAGAVPGPACYGRGGNEPTVTDANLLLGRLDPEGFLGGAGQIALDRTAAHRVLAPLGAALGISTAAAALGVVRIANATMERALRAVSVEQGYDPREFTLLPFGGAGPLHACDLADALDIRRVFCPATPGVLSAYGMLVADVVTEHAQSILHTAGELLADPTALRSAGEALAAKASAVMAQERAGAYELSAAVDMRYRGQSYELTAPIALPIEPSSVAQAVEAFHGAHQQRYGYAMQAETVEVVTLRVRATAPGAQIEQPASSPTARPRRLVAEAAKLAPRPIWFEAQDPVEAQCYARARLSAGEEFAGPAVVFQYDSTILVAPGWQAYVDGAGNLWLEREESI